MGWTLRLNYGQPIIIQIYKYVLHINTIMIISNVIAMGRGLLNYGQPIIISELRSIYDNLKAKG